MTNDTDLLDEDARSFRALIVQTTHCTLELVQQAGNGLSPDERDQALHILSYALNLDDAWCDARKLLLALAPTLELMGQRYTWIPFLERGIEESLRRDDHQSAAEYQLQLAVIYRMVSEFEQAHALVRKSLHHFILVGDKRWQARSFNELAWIEHLTYRFDVAWQHAHEALHLLAENDVERGMTYRVLGLVTQEQNRFLEAETYHRQSLAYFQVEQNERKISWALQNLARALHNQGRFEEAIVYYQRAAETLNAINDNYHWALLQMNLGTLYCNQNQPDKGLTHHSNANHTLVKLGDKLNVAKSYTGLGIAHLMLQHFAEAEIAFCYSIEHFRALDLDALRLNAVDGLAMTYLAMQSFDQAIQLLELALAELPRIRQAPNYAYLLNSIANHLQAAKESQRV